MGKKLGHNWKARFHRTTSNGHNMEAALIDLDLVGIHAEQYDSSNPLVLPSRKRKTKNNEIIGQGVKRVRKLTKKERKKLERIKDRKEMKMRHGDILARLQSLHASQNEMDLLTGITDIHCGHLKNSFATAVKSATCAPNSIRGSRKLRYKCADISEKKTVILSDAESIDTSDISTDHDDEQCEADTQKFTASEKRVASAVESSVQDDKKDKKYSCTYNLIEEVIKEKNVGSKLFNRDNPTTVFVPVSRKPEIQASRQKLPIFGEEQAIMELINENDVTIISGETGSGKTTQVPQFLYEAGYAREKIIGVTEPRRVAAISMSKRVAEEMDLTSRQVSYQIRYEGNCTQDTHIKFMTDGVLLREIEQDFLLSKYSVIIIDEAHERSIFTDIVIGLLSRIVPFRRKKNMLCLKLVIMSATLDKVQFLSNQNLFRARPAEIDIASRQYPVDHHFARHTDDDYLSAAFKKVCKIHQRESPGGILVFVTGQQEVQTLCKKLKKLFPFHPDDVVDQTVKHESRKQRKQHLKSESCFLTEVDLSKYTSTPMDENPVDDKEKGLPTFDYSEVDDYDSGDDTEQVDLDDLEISTKDPLWVLPLYSLLSSDKQNRVFLPTPPICRLCIVATNVAETSLTIPNIYYVVDTGKTKKKFYDRVTGVSTFKITWTSKASADQRKGRAGRVGHGKCFRLYSSAVFNHCFDDHLSPEIINRPVDDLVLQMKAMAITKVANFPFPTPPYKEQIKAAEKLLLSLRALEQKPGTKSDGLNAVVTSLGRTMAKYPVAPRYARMLVATETSDLLPYVIIAVAALSVDELFVVRADIDAVQADGSTKQLGQGVRAVKKMWVKSGQSRLLGDMAVLIKAVGACEADGQMERFCIKHSMRYKALQEIRKLRSQLTRNVNLKNPELNLVIDPRLTPPTESQLLELRKIVTVGLADHVARLCTDLSDVTTVHHKRAYKCAELEDPVYIHPTSVLYKDDMEYVVYQHIQQTSRQYMKGVIAIDPQWLPQFAPFHCRFSDPLADPPPFWEKETGKVMCHRKATFGPSAWQLGIVCVEYPPSPECYCWFGRFLLEGLVVPELAKYAPDLLCKPLIMIKTWARLQPRTETLKRALSSRGVSCREDILQQWRADPKYLLNAFLDWLPDQKHWHVRDDWPPVKK